jgi:methenyltetrahydromethanopterin cyclohydrolase
MYRYSIFEPDSRDKKSKMKAISLNETAREAIAPLLNRPELYRVSVKKTTTGATIVDCGVEQKGSFGAGIIFSKACLSGLAEVVMVEKNYAGMGLPAVSVSVNHPVEACMASQYAGWALCLDKYFAMGSGPARALYGKEELFNDISHKEESDFAVLMLETGELPGDDVIEYLVSKLGVEPQGLYVLAAPTASIVGSVQVPARIVETSMHKLHEIGFKLDTVIHGVGFAPVPPIASNDLKAIGRTNDCVLYGGLSCLTLDCDEDYLVENLEKIPSSASKDHGRTFYELFKEYGDFYKIDPMLFSPAVIQINNIRTGTYHTCGEFSPELLKKSFGA